MPTWDHSAISFRSCRGGEILAQQYNKNSIVISVLNDALQVSLAGPSVIGIKNRLDVRLPYQLLDNRWHMLQFKYEYGNLYLHVDKESIIFGKHSQFGLLGCQLIPLSISLSRSQLYLQQSVPYEPGHWQRGGHSDTWQLVFGLPSGWTGTAVCRWKHDHTECCLWSVSIVLWSVQRAGDVHTATRQLLP